MKKVIGLFLVVFFVPMFLNAYEVTDRISNPQTDYRPQTYQDPSRDTTLGTVVFELDLQTPCADNQLLGIEFDGTYFYATGGNTGVDPNKVYVFDTVGTLIWTMDQPVGSTGWGWRDLAWDGVYTGTDRIDTLYASVSSVVDAFGIDLTSGALNTYGTITGPANPNRALACKQDSGWFFTANWDPCYKFSRTNANIQSVTGPGSTYGMAYDTDSGWVWLHSQIDPGTSYSAQIDQMEPMTMTWPGVTFGYTPTLNTPDPVNNMAGGLCYYSNFRGMDVLFAMLQGATVDEVLGIFLRWHPSGVTEKPTDRNLTCCFLSTPNPTKDNTTIKYSTTMSGHVSLKIYDRTGQVVRTLVDRTEPAGTKSVYWDGKNDTHASVPDGVYFLKLEASNSSATQKLTLVR